MAYDPTGGPPPFISLPGGGGSPALGGGGSDEDAYQSLIDGTNDVETLVQWAKMALAKAINIEPDHEDKLLLEKMTTEAQQYLAQNQKLQDQAVGAGPGVKLVRKATGGGGY